ncbi:NAD(P)-dependent oxidoreductase [Geobacter sp. DSM 9736]|uniref:NAD-dependent epimerase/dehydratase family protein n=1 Tax=Geobacter sp. DSM 9736 TaxID=1277350 RepID=UPI000B5088F7|nr:NAD-dependent epimerase/dehydratase family protein [Geobacter sp. DSM 9736]SNB47498.1 dTDP-L-rhamnose 4-epimerase [Geobacter sp. DSM 9736]
MACSVLITGGAGFIGSHLADELLRHGYRVRALDSLVPQVHGPNGKRPAYLDPEVELVKGDVRDPETVKKALRGIDAVYHFAALVGVGQSMYEIEKYTSVNNHGTAVLLEAVAAAGCAKLVVASSMSIYGEGLYRDSRGEIRQGLQRPLSQLRDGVWELYDDKRQPLAPLPTPESKVPSLASVYALSKYDQEVMSLIVGSAYRIPVVALRFFNVYGTRQALSNPYTGVLAIFASRLLNGNSPRIFEDGLQQRDFVSVHDVAKACRLALENDRADGRVLNIGSGTSHTVNEVSRRLARLLNREDIEPCITGSYRTGDIRHCFADIAAARELLGYQPKISLEEGLVDLAGWLTEQIAVDYVTKAHAELSARGLTL